MRLSSFNRFAKHEDERRQDKVEGRNVNVIYSNSGQTSFVVSAHTQALVVCGSATRDLSANWISSSNRYAISIFDSKQFARDVINALHEDHALEVVSAARGHCVYAEYGIEYLVDNINLDALNKLSKQEADLQLNELLGLKPYFRKRPRFSNELEYRWVWVTKKPCPETVVVEIPNARKYCRKTRLTSRWEKLKTRFSRESAKDLIESAAYHRERSEVDESECT